MKILYISDSYEGGGAEAVFRDTMQVTRASGFDVDYFVPEQKTGPVSYVFSLKNYLAVREKLNAFMPDVIHLHNYYHFLSPSVLLAIRKYKSHRKCRVVYTAHDYHLICPNSGLQHFVEQTRVNFSHDKNDIHFNYRFDHRSWFHSHLKVLQHVLAYRILKLRNVFDVIVSPGQFMKSTLRRYGITLPIEVVRNPVSLPEIQEQKRTDAAGIQMVYAGRLSPEKGLVELIRKLDRETCEEIVFHIYGDGDMRDAILHEPCQEGLSVVLHGAVDRETLVAELPRYDFFVLPSLWYENAPVSLIEAAAAGLPVLVSGYGGLLEMAQESSCYFTFDHEEETLLEVLLKAEKRRGQNTLFSPHEFSYETYQRKIIRVYRP